MINRKVLGSAGVAGLAMALVAQPAWAAVPDESAYVFNTFLFLVAGFLVMFMAAGFCMLEAGSVRSKNVATICLKNIALYALAGVMFYLIGYNLMYQDVGEFGGGWFGMPGLWSPDDSAIEGGDFSGGYAASSDWYFQMVFVATTASIVSGTLAERIKIWPFLIFVAILTALIYPIQGAWKWGGGWLDVMGFADFAGSTIVHSVGGWAALTGAIVLGAREGRYGADGTINPMPGSSLPLVTLGTFILWLGWFGFNGGSQLAIGSAADAVAVANIFVNTNTAAAGGLLVAMVLTHLFFGRIILSTVLNGALAGLVSITAAPDTPTMGLAFLIGGVGGLIVVFTEPLLEKLGVDDVVGAIPVHLFAGIWGTLAVALTYQADDTTMAEQFVIQATGVGAIAGFVIVSSLVVWLLLRFTLGLRASTEQEQVGLDMSEQGMKAYPEFV